MRNDLNIEIGKRVRRQREVQGLTREYLAEQIEISSRFLADIELGTKGMSFQTLIRLSKTLRVSTDYLLLGKEAPAGSSRLIHLLSGVDQRYYKQLEALLSAYCNTIEIAKK